jgi:uncharacterized protein (UPF0371 family)
MKKGFDTKKYLKIQAKAILDRMNRFDEKLYLEFGGKLCCDHHAQRVLPGYEPRAKIKILQTLKDKLEVVYCISAKQIEERKRRGDSGLPYGSQTLKEIKELRESGIEVSCVVITRFEGEESAKKFRRKLENYGNQVYIHYEIKGYPTRVEKITSKNGLGKQEYIKTKKPIVIITGAGGGSGKMETCLSQLYYDRKKGIASGYAKFETFPVWNLPLDHPTNIAYEAATADMGDVNMIDPFHLKAYKKTAVNYSRDIENFSIMQDIIKKISKKGDPLFSYKSPTDMGVNRIAWGIKDQKIIKEAGKQELIRRFFQYKVELFEGLGYKETVERAKILMKKAGAKIEDRKIVLAARKIAKENSLSVAALELPGDIIVTGKSSSLLHAESAVILNALKILAKIPDEIHLISENIIRSINNFKEQTGDKSKSLNLTETFIALAISATTNPAAELALKKLKNLQNTEMHTTHISVKGDSSSLRKIGVNLTSDSKLSKYSIF